MGGKGGKKKGSNATPGFQPRVSMTLREESSGKKQGNVNAKTMCKLDHLKNLAVWAAAEGIPSLGGFFGERLAATTEALGLRSDPSLFACERCESILQPGDNCTVRIEKNKPKKQRRRKKSNPPTQNNVVYRCHFCSHKNLMRGTPKGYLKQISLPKPKPRQKLQSSKMSVEKDSGLTKAKTSIDGDNKLDIIALPTIEEQNLETSIPATPAPTTRLSLLDSKRKKRNRSGVKKAVEPNLETSIPATPAPTTRLSLLDSKRKKRNRSGVKKAVEPETSSTAADAEKSVVASRKRRKKKTWTSLKEIAQSNEHDIGKRKLSNLSIPFFI